MSITTKIAAMKQHEDRRHDAISAVAAILQLDQSDRDDLISYLKALNEAQQAGDEQEQEYLARAILEFFEADTDQDVVDLDEWVTQVSSSPQGQNAARELEQETQRFFDAYQQCKVHSDLMTIEAVAQAAGLTSATIKAIEEEKVKPQLMIFQSLAKAFQVDPGVFNGK